MSYVLVAEDDLYIRMLIQRKLESAGFTVRLFEDGAEALQMALSDPPRILLLDVMLPGLSGLEVCQGVKQHFGDKSPPVVMVSARGQPTDVEAAELVGADDYLIKPFSPNELLTRVQQILSR